MRPLSHADLPSIPAAVVPLLNALALSHSVYQLPHQWVLCRDADAPPSADGAWRRLHIASALGTLDCQVDLTLLETILRPQLASWAQNQLTDRILELALRLALPAHWDSQVTDVHITPTKAAGDYVFKLQALPQNIVLGQLGVTQDQITPLASLLVREQTYRPTYYPSQLDVSLRLECGYASLQAHIVAGLAEGDIIFLRAIPSPIAPQYTAAPAPQAQKIP